jgi:hypothetical protein
MFESSASIAMMKHSKGRRARRAAFGRFYGVVRPSRAIRPHRSSRRERPKTARARTCQSGQRPRAPRNDRTRLGSPDGSEGQFADRVVLEANVGCPPRNTQDDGRRAGSQAPHHCGGSWPPARCRQVCGFAGGVNPVELLQIERHLDIGLWPSRRKFRMGPPPRSFAAYPHDCIVVAILLPSVSSPQFRRSSRRRFTILTPRSV